MEDERTEIWERAKISERETEREGERQKKSEWGEDEWMALFFCQEKRGRHDLALDIALQAKKRDAFLPHDWLLQLFSQVFFCGKEGDLENEKKENVKTGFQKKK